MAAPTPSVYGSNPAFAGVIPIPQDDGPHPLAQIAYSEHYAEAMSYLRALMAGDGEMSERALELTGDIIAMNPAHYTVWAYRGRILFALKGDLVDELDFIDGIAEQNPKNYQIYHHRQRIVQEMSNRGIANFERELDFTEQLIDADQKNYHVWSYRQWLVKHFELSHSLEIAFTERLIENDILNNSAWSHRYYALFGNGATSEKKGEEVFDSEVEYAKKIIRKLSSNGAAWNYLRGSNRLPTSLISSVLKKANRPLSSIEAFALEFAPITTDTDVVEGMGKLQLDATPTDVSDTTASEVPTVSIHALDVLAEINAQKNAKLARFFLQELAGIYDTLRKGYWEFRMEKVGEVAA